MANNTFLIRRTSTSGRTPNTTSSSNTQYISTGELALNLTDRKLFSSDGTNLIEVGSNLTATSIGGGALAANASRVTITGVPISANGSFGIAGQVLASNGATGSPYWTTSTGGSPGGANTQVQFRDSTVFGGSAGFTFDKTTNAVSIAGAVFVGANSVINTNSFRSTSTANALIYTVLNADGVQIRDDRTAVLGRTTVLMEATSFRILDNQYNNIYIGMQYDTLLPYFNLEARNPVNPGAGLAAYVRGKLSNFDLKFDSGFNSYPPLVNLELDTNDGYNDYNYNYGKLDLFSFTDLNLGYYDRGLSIDPSAGIRLYYYDSNGDLVGNYFTLNSTGLTIGSGFIANTTGAYHTNIVNAASHTTSATTSNTTGFFPTSNTPALSLGNSTALWVISANSVAANSVTVTGGNLNTAAIFSSGTVNAANFNTTGYVNTGTLTAATSANVGANVQITTSAVTIGNSTLTTSVSETIYSNTGSASLIVANGTSLATNTTIFANGVNTTGFINAVSHTVGSNFIANSSAIVGTGYANVTTSVNSALLTVGTSFIANTTGVYHTATVNAANIAVGTSFIANTSQVTISGIPLQANGGVGTAGQVLTSNGATGSPYWSTSSGGGSIVSGSGTAILNFGTPGTSGNNEATIAVSGLTTIASTAQVRVWIASDATSSNHTAGDHKYFTSLAGLSVSSVSAGVGFSIFARSIHKLSGNWTVNYFWQNY